MRPHLEPAVTDLLSRLHGEDGAQRARGERTDASLKAVHPTVGELLYRLVIDQGARNILEMGTSHGVSTLYLAAAARHTGGRVVTVDRLAEKTAIADRHLAEAGLGDVVELATAELDEFVAGMPSASERHSAVDFVFVDVGIPAVAPVWSRLEAMLTGDATLLVDGGPPGYWQEPPMADFIESLRQRDWLVSLLPMHKQHLLGIRGVVADPPNTP